MKYLKYIALASLLILVSACSTREVVDKRAGSTEQRLITYSIEKLIKELPADDFELLRGKHVKLTSHFIIRDHLLDYADNLFRLNLEHRFGIKIAGDGDTVDAEIDLFFESIGTDTDVAGFSIPIINLSDTSQSSRINLLALDMYHGITECHYFIRNLEDNTITRSNRFLARVRTDKVATPFISFPFSHL